jgi:hypothetical protein
MGDTSMKDHVRTVQAALGLDGGEAGAARGSLMMMDRELENLQETVDIFERRATDAEAKLLDLQREVPRAWLRALGSRDEGWCCQVNNAADNEAWFITEIYDSRESAVLTAFHWAMWHDMMVVPKP